MASKNRGQSPDLIEELLRSARHYNYFQTVRLLRQFLRGKQGAKIRTRPELSFAFPVSDISELRFIPNDEGGLYQITATFLGLYGVDSPLPNFYTEDLFFEASQDKSTCRDFLDIFNQRLYDLLYRCWHKYQLFFQVVEEKNPDSIQRLFCLLGLGEPEFRQFHEPQCLLRYIGLLTQWPRSALGLRAMLRDATCEESLDIEPCIPRKVHIPDDQKTYLGLSCSTLGVDTVMGSEVEDYQGRFRISIGPLTGERFLEFAPGGKNYGKILRLTEFYLLHSMEYEISLSVNGDDVQGITLGARAWSRLGTDTWLVSGKMDQCGRAIFIHTKGEAWLQ